MNRRLAIERESGATSQRYRIPGQGGIRLSFLPGERITVSSQDGHQCCELLALDGNGLVHAAIDPPGARLACLAVAQLHRAGEASQALRKRFDEWRIDPALMTGGVQLPGEALPWTLTLPADADPLILVLLAPGEDMTVDGQCPATELDVEHWRHASAGTGLPPPLASCRAEIRIPHSSARVYEVRAGEWIQVIDVAGKQCSDFIAFDKAALAHGEELTLDSTATRTLAGTALPQPGLYSRVTDIHQQPMLELVQDTVGRHDSFLLACTPKYYEDSGYFGHISCTENFNRELAPFGIRSRSGWPALNLFFNTQVEPCGSLTQDEPWSRPGDYVLLRATRDLLCASSACPDDIDPANGWCPTDIHIRLYGAEQHFPRAIASRVTPEELPRMTQQTAFHDRTSALTKRFIEYRGYWVPEAFEGWGARAEYLACRERVAVMDLSPLRKFEVVGPDAESLLQYALTRNVRRLAVGEIVYSAACHETGGMLDDGTLFRMSEQGFRWICGAPYNGIWLRELAAQRGARVSIRESSAQLHNLAIQGPRSRELLETLIWNAESQPSVAGLRWFHFMIGRLGGPEGIPLMVSRTGYTGELGFEVWCHPKHAEAVWDAIWEAGKPYGLAPLGFAALDMLRIEAGLIFADHEFCPQINPFEAGIGFTVPLKTKEEDFMGRNALASQSPEGRHKLVGLRLSGAEVPTHGDLVYQGRFPVGVVTSATQSPLLGCPIALCRLAPQFTAPGTRLEVGRLDGHQKRLAAEVAILPFHDPERLRVRS
ncbi:DUF1989 domain-containing protein [Billgrantia endophytica]|uniref:Aminomethyltransferase n=1 Tax=Billgrantia endophytica TaxID=2033802 RepID=A0A2N7TXS7_9GAMM|nr:aminomethyltransferase family protein [Halomonas endophytica]PMR72986.1 aminomethyltransferase [Halomonas endophytica]